MDQVDDIQIQLPAKAQYLNIVSACILAMAEHVEELEAQEQTVYQIQLAVHEICNNIIEHAYQNSEGSYLLKLRIDSEKRQVSADIFDQGEAFDFSDVSEPNLDEPQDKGYGLFLVRHLVDEVSYESSDQNNHWFLTKKY